jgi:hypothetical protein
VTTTPPSLCLCLSLFLPLSVSISHSSSVSLFLSLSLSLTVPLRLSLTVSLSVSLSHCSSLTPGSITLASVTSTLLSALRPNLLGSCPPSFFLSPPALSLSLTLSQRLQNGIRSQARRYQQHAPRRLCREIHGLHGDQGDRPLSLSRLTSLTSVPVLPSLRSSRAISTMERNKASLWGR